MYISNIENKKTYSITIASFQEKAWDSVLIDEFNIILINNIENNNINQIIKDFLKTHKIPTRGLSVEAVHIENIFSDKCKYVNKSILYRF